MILAHRKLTLLSSTKYRNFSMTPVNSGSKYQMSPLLIMVIVPCSTIDVDVKKSLKIPKG